MFETTILVIISNFLMKLFVKYCKQNSFYVLYACDNFVNDLERAFNDTGKVHKTQNSTGNLFK